MISESSAILSPMELARQATDEILASLGIECQGLDLTLDSSWAKVANLFPGTIAKNLDNEDPGVDSSGIPGHTGTIRSILLGKK